MSFANPAFFKSTTRAELAGPTPARRLTRVQWGAVAVTVALIVALFGRITFSDLPLTGPDPQHAYYNRLAAGLLKGQLSLDRTPPIGLAQLSDPYDPAASEPYRRLGPENIHDLSFYRGRLYLYFGVSPAIVVFAPYHLLTGQWLSHAAAVWLFVSVGFCAQAAVLVACWRRYFASVSFGVLIASIVGLGLIPPGVLVLQRPEVWEVAVTCAFAGVAIALAALWCALHSIGRSIAWTALASIAYGIAIGARPVVAPGAIVVLAPLAHACWRDRTVPGAGGWRRYTSLLLAAVTPLAAIGAALLAYNFARFENAFEFGQKYQIAGDRQDTIAHFGLSYFWFHVRTYFFAVADWRLVFPFVAPIAPRALPMGHGPTEPPWGLFANVPFTLIALAAPFAFANAQPKRSQLRVFVTAAAFVVVTSTVVVCLFYAMMLRYQCDFAPPLVLLASIGVLVIEQSVGAAKHLARVIWSTLLVFSVGFNLAAAGVLHADRLHQLAIERRTHGDTIGALAAAEAALKFQPHDVPLRRTLLELLVASGQTDGVKQHFAALLRDGGSETDATAVADFFAATNRHDEAVAALDLALAKWPRSVPLIYQRATEYRQLGWTKDAMEQLQYVLRLAPRNAGALCDLGAMLAEQGRMDEAEQAFRGAIEIEPRQIAARFFLAQVYMVRGDATHARAELHRVLEIDPGFRPAQEALAAIER